MKVKKIVKTIIVCAWALLFCIHPPLRAQEGYREPFAESRETVFDNTLPSQSSQTTSTSAGQALKAPPSQGGNPLGIGSVKDALWMPVIFCLLYTAVKTMKRKKSNEKVFNKY